MIDSKSPCKNVLAQFSEEALFGLVLHGIRENTEGGVRIVLAIQEHQSSREAPT